MRHLTRVAAAAILFSLLSPASATAQDTTRASVSGVLYTHFQSGGSRAERDLGQQNRFEIERAYLTVMAPVMEHLRVRATADIFQQRDDSRGEYYGGWTYRLKFAYAEYAYLRDPASSLTALARMGMIPTAIIDHEEKFWNRGIAQTALDREGYMSTADVGAATQLTLRDRAELLVGVFNGPGYQQRETDRFKDVGARLVITPFGARPGFLQSLAITPWYYKGWRASALATERSGRQRDRYGVHAAIREPRMTLGAQLARRVDESEEVTTLPATSVNLVEATGGLVSAYALVRPLGFLRSGGPGRLSLVARVDDVRADVDRDAAHRYLIGGLTWDLTSRAQLGLDFQAQEARNGSRAADLKTLFARAVIAF